MGFHLTELSSPRANITAYMTISKTGGGELKDLIYVISSYFIFSNAFAASSSNGSTLAKSFSHESLKALASYFYIPVNLSSS